MKILIINKFYRPVGGPEIIVFDMMRELADLGHTTIPFATSHPDNIRSEYAEYFAPGVDYNTKRGKRFGRLLKEAVDLVYSAEAKRRIEALIRQAEPDVAHAHNIYHQLSPSILTALRKAGIPTVLTLHDGKLLCANMLFLKHGVLCEECAGRRFYRAVVNRCVKDSLAGSLLCCIEGTLHRSLRLYERNVDLFITPSRFLKDKLVQHGRLQEWQIEVLANYADTASVTPDFSPGDYGLFVGKLEAHKGVRTLLRACKELPDFRVKIAGRGPLYEEATCFAEREGLDKVELVGFQMGEELARLFREARFVVIPSEWYENCPMVVLEAFSAGKPVIASRIGGIPELVEHEVDGFLFEPGNADELAAYMRTLVDNPALAREMGRAGRRKAEERYSIDAFMQSLINIYKRVQG